MRDCLLLLSFLSIVSIGCSFTPPDINAGVGGSADGGTPDAFTFADGAVCSSACVSATELRDCGQAGAVVDCALGCVDGVAPKCAALVPSNDVDASLLDDVSGTLFDLAATASWVVDSDTGRIVDGTIEIRAAVEGAVDAGVGFYRLDNGASLFTVTGVLVEAGAEIRFEGSRPVIVAAGDRRERGRGRGARSDRCGRRLPGQSCGHVMWWTGRRRGIGQRRCGRRVRAGRGRRRSRGATG